MVTVLSIESRFFFVMTRLYLFLLDTLSLFENKDKEESSRSLATEALDLFEETEDLLLDEKEDLLLKET